MCVKCVRIAQSAIVPMRFAPSPLCTLSEFDCSVDIIRIGNGATTWTPQEMVVLITRTETTMRKLRWRYFLEERMERKKPHERRVLVGLLSRKKLSDR